MTLRTLCIFKIIDENINLSNLLKYFNFGLQKIKEMKKNNPNLYSYYFDVLCNKRIEFKDLVYYDNDENTIKYMLEFKYMKHIWDHIAHFGNLSENFISEFQGYLNWSLISAYQVL